MREVVSQYLIQDRHAVKLATNGRETLSKFQSGSSDVVVTDMAMPEMSGDQLAAAIKRASPDTPVILLSGFGDMLQAVGARPEAVDLVVSKPVKLATLREALATVG